MARAGSRGCFLVWGVALGTRLIIYGFALGRPDVVFLDNFDTHQYYDLATNLVSHSSFSTYPAVSFMRGALDFTEPDGFRLPVYPLVLSVPRAIFGDRPLAILLWQLFLCSLVAPAVLLVATRAFGDRAGLLAGLFAAVEPGGITLGAYFFADAFFQLSMALSVVGFWLYLQKPRPWAGAAFGLLAGLATLTKPITLFIFPVLFLFRLKNPRSLALAGLTYLVLIGGWCLRNQLVFGIPTLSGVTGYNLYFHHYPAMLAQQEGTDYTSRCAQVREEFNRAHGPVANPVATTDSLGKWAFSRMLAHPVDYAAAHFKNLYTMFVPEIWEGAIYYGRMVSPGISSKVFRGEIPLRDVPKTVLSLPRDYLGSLVYKLVSLLAIVFLLLAGAVGAWRMWPRRAFVAGLVLLTLYLALVPGPTAQGRFRTAFVPPVALLAGAAFARKKPQGP